MNSYQKCKNNECPADEPCMCGTTIKAIRSHTPTPWHRMGLSIMDQANAEKQASGANYGVDCIAFVNRVNGKKEQSQWHDEIAQANAEFIVRAVNSHDALIKLAKEYAINYQDRISTLEDEINDSPDEDTYEMLTHWKLCLKDAEKAIAQAEGKDL